MEFSVVDLMPPLSLLINDGIIFLISRLLLCHPAVCRASLASSSLFIMSPSLPPPIIWVSDYRELFPPLRFPPPRPRTIASLIAEYRALVLGHYHFSFTYADGSVTALFPTFRRRVGRPPAALPPPAPAVDSG